MTITTPAGSITLPDLFEALSAILFWLNALTFVITGLDKSLAKFPRANYCCGRVSESVILTLSLLGGSPGCYLAQQAFRHKTQKRTFLFQFYAIVLVQLLLAVYVLAFGVPGMPSFGAGGKSEL